MKARPDNVWSKLLNLGIFLKKRFGGELSGKTACSDIDCPASDWNPANFKDNGREDGYCKHDL
jgi:hypothetical protein